MSNSSASGYPHVLRLAGKSLRVHFSRGILPPLPGPSRLLRRTKNRAGQIASRYWKLNRGGCYRLEWPGAATIDLDSRRAIATCYLAAETPRGAIEEFLRGPVCAFFLMEHGFEPLHASAVALGGRCIAFAANPGAGKSALVAWLTRHGARFVCDDILPLEEKRGVARAHPGLAQIRLEPLAARKLNWKGMRGAKREPHEKSKFRVPTARGALPVARIYLLQRLFKSKNAGARRQVEIRNLEPRAAFRALLKSTRNDSLDTPARLRRQMALFAHLVRQIPVCRLRFSSGFDRFPAILARIRDDLSPSAL